MESIPFLFDECLPIEKVSRINCLLRKKMDKSARKSQSSFSKTQKKPASPNKDYLATCRRSLGMDGIIRITDPSITSLAKFGVQPRLKILDISKSNIDSLDSLKPQPNLVQIIADSSQLSSFAGLSRHKLLRDVSFTGTPLSQKLNCRLACIIVVGRHISIVNKKTVRKSEREEAEQYPKIAKYLLEAGWDLEYPAPSPEHFKELAESEQYRPYLEPYLTQKSEQLFRIKKSKNDNQEPNDSQMNDERLEEDLNEILRSTGIRVKQGKNRQEEILKALNDLVNLVKTFETCADDIKQMKIEDSQSEATNETQE